MVFTVVRVWLLNAAVPGFGLRVFSHTVPGAFPCPVRELPVHLLLRALDVDATYLLPVDARPFQGDHLPEPCPQLETERNPQTYGVIILIEVVQSPFFGQGLLIRHEHLTLVGLLFHGTEQFRLDSYGRRLC